MSIFDCEFKVGRTYGRASKKPIAPIEEVLDIKIGSGDFSIIDFFGGGANVAIGGFILALLISLGLALMIRKRTLNSIDLDEYIESWDSLTIQNEKEKPLISDDELDI